MLRGIGEQSGKSVESVRRKKRKDLQKGRRWSLNERVNIRHAANHGRRSTVYWSICWCSSVGISRWTCGEKCVSSLGSIVFLTVSLIFLCARVYSLVCVTWFGPRTAKLSNKLLLQCFCCCYCYYTVHAMHQPNNNNNNRHSYLHLWWISVQKPHRLNINSQA